MSTLFILFVAWIVLRVLRLRPQGRGRSSAQELYERRLRDGGWR